MYARIAVLAAFALCIVGGGMYYFSPSASHKREAQSLLDGVAAALDTQNAAAFKNALSDTLADDARVELQVKLPSASSYQAGAEKEAFSKSDFLAFMDNTLYSLGDYHFKAHTESFTPGVKTTGSLTFTATGSAQGASGSLAEAGMHIGAYGQCAAELSFPASGKPLFHRISCVMELHYKLAPVRK